MCPPVPLDYGVMFISNSSYANLTAGRGLGQWSVDSVGLVKRFLGPDVVIPVDFASGANAGAFHVLDLSKGGIAMPAQTPEEQAAQQAALGAVIADMYAFMAPYGDWITTGKRPDPVPAELLKPYLQTVAERNWWSFVLGIGFNILQGSGYAPLSKLTTLDGLHAVTPLTLDMFTRSGASFSIAGGCHNLYEAMRAYVGVNRVILNANIKSVIRPKNANAQRPIVVHGFIESNNNAEAKTPDAPLSSGPQSVPATPFNYRCDKIVLAFAPLLHNLQAFQLEDAEYDLFATLEAHYYLAMVLNYTGGSLASVATPFTIFNMNFTNLPTLESALPNLSIISRVLPIPGSLTGAWANADGPVSFDDIRAAVERDLAVIETTGLLTGLQALGYKYHYYSPIWSAGALAASPSADTVLRNLQGQRGTYYVSATAAGVDSTSTVWNHAYELVQAHFPAK